MSRIGNRVIAIPENVTVEIIDKAVFVKGPKGELSFPISRNIVVEFKDNTVLVSRKNENIASKQMHGTTNALITNMILGVTTGYEKELEIVGVGYKFNIKGNKLVVNAGFSHIVEIDIPADLKLESKSNTEIKVSGISKERVGEFAANIRKLRKPEPYKGKGIRYAGEHIRRKEGKKAK
jgi:large subunit ribosomal protein L6